MRIVITSIGSMGDIQPFIALADELRKHNHTCTFALPAHLLPYVQRRGFHGIQLGPDSLSIAYYEAARSFEQGKSSDSGYISVLLAAAPQAFREVSALCFNADLLISSVIMPIGRIVHEAMGIPFISIQTHNPAEEISFPEELNILRTQLNLPTIEDPVLHGVSPQMMLIAISHTLLSAHTRWPDHYHITGFLFPDEKDWLPNSELRAFLDDGPLPIAVTMGSNMQQHPDQLTALFLQAIARTNNRAIIQHSWTGLVTNIQLPETIYAVDYIPHNWLFHQIACVIHHGGGGTTAAALRAGVPTIVIPSDPGVFPWAYSADALGCAGAVIPYQTLSVEKLETAINETLTNPTYRMRSQEIGKQIEAEQGTQAAYKLIQQFMEQHSSGKFEKRMASSPFENRSLE